MKSLEYHDYYHDPDFDIFLQLRLERLKRFFETPIYDEDRNAAHLHAITYHHLYDGKGRTTEQKIKDITFGKCAELALYRAFPNMFQGPPNLHGNANGYDAGYDLIKIDGLLIDVKCNYQGKSDYRIGAETHFNCMRRNGMNMDNLIFVFLAFDNISFDKSVEFSVTGYLSYNEISKLRLGIKDNYEVINVKRIFITDKMNTINNYLKSLV